MQILHMDMDSVLVDFPSGIARVSDALQEQYNYRLDEAPRILNLMDPMPNAIESYNCLNFLNHGVRAGLGYEEPLFSIQRCEHVLCRTVDWSSQPCQ